MIFLSGGREVYADCKLQTLSIWAAFPIMHRSKGRIYKEKHQQLLQDWGQHCKIGEGKRQAYPFNSQGLIVNSPL